MTTANDILWLGTRTEVQGKGAHESVPGPVNEEFWNSVDTILNSHCPHSPLEAATEIPSTNIGDTLDPPLE
jgi:hypothetical protein